MMTSHGSTHASRKGRVLFLDDDTDTRELLDMALAGEGYEVVLGGSIAEGLRLARSGQFDMILLDWHFADGTGIELCQAIRNFDMQTPILFYTGMAYDQHIRSALQAGAQGCLIKPVAMETLLNTIAHAIAAHSRNPTEKMT